MKYPFLSGLQCTTQQISNMPGRFSFGFDSCDQIWSLMGNLVRFPIRDNPTQLALWLMENHYPFVVTADDPTCHVYTNDHLMTIKFSTGYSIKVDDPEVQLLIKLKWGI